MSDFCYEKEIENYVLSLRKEASWIFGAHMCVFLVKNLAENILLMDSWRSIEAGFADFFLRVFLV